MLDTLPQLILDETDSEAVSFRAPADNDAVLLDAYSRAVAGVADTVGPAVVRVDTRRKNARQPGGGTGSGVILSPDGLILTNSHVVAGAHEIRLSDAEGRTTDAQLIGEDPDTDLALLRANAARDLPCGAARRFQAAAARSARRRDRQPARLRIDRHGRRHLGARPVARRSQRPADRGRDPDRCRAQSGQFRRAAGLDARTR